MLTKKIRSLRSRRRELKAAVVNAFFVASLSTTPSALAVPIVVAGPSAAIAADSGRWSFDGTALAGFRTALGTPSNFGPTGIVETEVQTAALGSFDAAALEDVDVFVSSWWSESESAPFDRLLVDYFLGGGSLLLLQDSSSRDAVGSLLGLSTIDLQSNPTIGANNPIFDGPFGTVGEVEQSGSFGILDEQSITDLGGQIVGRNGVGPTIASWGRDDFALGAGALVILADIDLISAPGGAQYGGGDGVLNDKGRLGLNAAAFLIPEPVSAALMLPLAAALVCRRQSA